MSSSKPDDNYAKGQKDYSQGRYEPPPGQSLAEVVGESLGMNPGYTGRDAQVDRKAYDDGYSHAQSQDSSSRLCFLTTACTSAQGLGDGCRELVVMRQFRDGVLMQSDEGRSMVSEYYRIAPAIVRAIDKRRDAPAVWDEVYVELVRPTVALLEADRGEDALAHYRAYTLRLERELLP